MKYLRVFQGIALVSVFVLSVGAFSACTRDTTSDNGSSTQEKEDTGDRSGPQDQAEQAAGQPGTTVEVKAIDDDLQALDTLVDSTDDSSLDESNLSDQNVGL